MQFTTLFVSLMAASFAAAAATPAVDSAPVDVSGPEYEQLGPDVVFKIEKRADKCGEGRPCAGANKDAACSSHCKVSCGKSWGQCGGLLWQTCVCRN